MPGYAGRWGAFWYQSLPDHLNGRLQNCLNSSVGRALIGLPVKRSWVQSSVWAVTFLLQKCSLCQVEKWWVCYKERVSIGCDTKERSDYIRPLQHNWNYCWKGMKLNKKLRLFAAGVSCPMASIIDNKNLSLLT